MVATPTLEYIFVHSKKKLGYIFVQRKAGTRNTYIIAENGLCHDPNPNPSDQRGLTDPASKSKLWSPFAPPSGFFFLLKNQFFFLKKRRKGWEARGLEGAGKRIQSPAWSASRAVPFPGSLPFDPTAHHASHSLSFVREKKNTKRWDWPTVDGCVQKPAQVPRRCKGCKQTATTSCAFYNLRTRKPPTVSRYAAVTSCLVINQ